MCLELKSICHKSLDSNWSYSTAAEPTMEKDFGGLFSTLQNAVASGLHSAKPNIFYILSLVPLK